MNPYITIYTTTLCPVCKMVKQFLDTFEVSYKEVNVDINPLVLLKLIGKTRKLSVPQTEINGKWVSGFDPEKLLKVINEARK
ncbi:glutaredoxin family protein [Paucisalibacillus sp. EB02]|uniref:glutaredoxin family protein n=1 Tax=Paucisalibacillus sp. EB02 TaxID=1347087 RepID=UPI0005AA9CB5|nr:glutaredoxin family protein [Paucisalibacillus sp. EB02]